MWPPRMAQAVDPVMLGKVRAKQYYSDDHTRERNMGILLHGDGSFSGQARSDARPGSARVLVLSCRSRGFSEICTSMSCATLCWTALMLPVCSAAALRQRMVVTGLLGTLYLPCHQVMLSAI